MKKYKLVFLLLFINFFFALAQVPQKFQYQLIVYNGTALQVNKTISVKVNITDQTGNTIHYREKHNNVVTNAQGLVTLLVGSGAVEQGVFSKIPWRSGSKYLKFQIDYNGETAPVSFVNYGAPYPLLSVPYALQSNSSSNIVSVLDYGADPSYDLLNDDTEAIQRAINENPGKTIFFPKGWYHIKKSIEINTSVNLLGDDKENTIIQPFDVADYGGFTGTNAINLNPNGLGSSITNMNILGLTNKAVPSLNTAIYCNTAYVNFENIIIEGFSENGIVFDKAYHFVVDNIFIRKRDNVVPYIKNGIIVTDQSINDQISNSNIQVTDKGIYTKTFVDAQLNPHTPEGLMIKNTTISITGLSNNVYGIYAADILSLHVSNCIINCNVGTGIYLYNMTGALVSNNKINILGNESYTSIGLVLSISKKNAIYNNTISTGAGNNVIVVSSSDETVLNNNIIELRSTPNANKKHILLNYSDVARKSYYNIISNNILRWKTSLTTNPSPVIYNNDSASTNNILNAVAPTFNIIYSNILQK